MPTKSPLSTNERIIATDVVAGRLSRRVFLQRSAALGLSTAATASLFAACGSSTPSSSSGDGMTMKIVDDRNTLWPVVQKYNKDFPHLKINTVVSSWGTGGRDMKEKELVMMSGGDYPDIAQMVWMKEFARSGLLVDLTDEVKKWDVYPRLQPGQLARMTYNGRIYGLTLGNNTIYQYYNQDILKQVGMTGPIKTLDELQTLAQKIVSAHLTTKDGRPIYTTTFDGGNWATDYWLWARGGTQMNNDYTKTLIDSPESIKAYSFMQNLVKMGAAPKPDGSSLQLWLNGRVALYFSGNWDALSTAQAKLNYGVSVMPKGPTGLNTTSIGGIEFAIFKNSSHQQESLSLLKAAASNGFQNNTDANAVSFVSNLSAYDDSGKQAAWKSQGPGVLQGELATRDQLSNTKYNFLEAPFVFPDAATIYNDALQQILIKLADPETVMKSTATQINQGIADALNQ